MASAQSGSRLTREEHRKSKELEELRKSGAAPPALDEEGKIINPHIPQYISSAPWYFSSRTGTDESGRNKKEVRPSLKHQYPSRYRLPPPSRPPLLSSSPSPSSFHCENCGSSSHDKQHCLERPRLKSRSTRHLPIPLPDRPTSPAETRRASDERETRESFDAKRDRWATFDVKEYDRVIERHEKEELARKKRKFEELEEALKVEEKKAEEAASKPSVAKGDSSSSSVPVENGNVDLSNESEVDKLRRLKRERRMSRLRKRVQTAAQNGIEASADTEEWKVEAEAGDESDDSDVMSSGDDEMKDYGEVITKMDTKSRTTVRNLRIREDTAKYLRNLDLKSAYYDPKTRAMRENPYPDKRPEEVLYAGDNFVRKSGDVREIQRLQQYVWDRNEKLEAGQVEHNELDSVHVHATALPSAAEKLFAAHQAQVEETKKQAQSSILSAYGGKEHSLTLPPAMLAVGEEFIEYNSAAMPVTRDAITGHIRSRYVENEYENGHTEIFGSWYDRETRRWGYACCHATLRHAMCVGEKGKHIQIELKQEEMLEQEENTSTTAVE